MSALQRRTRETLPARPVLCVLCDQPVKLETSKTDEDGRAVHDECYFAKLSGKPLPAVELPDRELELRMELERLKRDSLRLLEEYRRATKEFDRIVAKIKTIKKQRHIPN
jgi:hypothetical protein